MRLHSPFKIPYRESAIIVTAMALSAVLAGHAPEYPGLYYDELLFIDIALGAQGDLYSGLHIGDLPVMVLSYLGALKAWLYYPLFKLTAVSAHTIRWPMVALGMLTLWVNYQLVKTAFSKPAALIFILLAAVEPTTLYHTRLDWGPTTLMMLFRGLLLWSALRWLKTDRPIYLLTALAAALLGIFDKLNFVWLAVSVAGALAVVYPQRVRGLLRQYAKIVTGGCILGILMLVAFLYRVGHLVHFQEIFVLSDLWPRLHYVVHNLLAGTIGGTAVYEFVVGPAGPMTARQLAAVSLAGIASGCMYWFLGKRSGVWKPLLFLILVSFLTLVQIFVTRRATGPHHTAMLAPLWLVIISAGLGLAFTRPGGNDRRWQGLAVAAAGVVMISSVAIDGSYLSGFRKPPANCNWDRGVEDLLPIIAAYPGHPVVCVDWGLATVIYGLTHGRVPIDDRWQSFLQPPAAATVLDIEHNLLPHRPLFVVRAAGKENFPQTRLNFLEMLRKQDWKVEKRMAVPARDGRPLNEVYLLAAPPQ